MHFAREIIIFEFSTWFRFNDYVVVLGLYLPCAHVVNGKLAASKCCLQIQRLLK